MCHGCRELVLPTQATNTYRSLATRHPRSLVYSTDHSEKLWRQVHTSAQPDLQHQLQAATLSTPTPNPPKAAASDLLLRTKGEHPPAQQSMRSSG